MNLACLCRSRNYGAVSEPEMSAPSRPVGKDLAMFRARLLSVPAVALALVLGCAPAAQQAAQTGGAQGPAANAVDQTATIGMSSMQPVLDPQLQLGDNGRRYDIFDCLLLPNEKGE